MRSTGINYQKLSILENKYSERFKKQWKIN